MKIQARRGVCIGVDRHLQAGDLADLDAAQVTFLVGIGAVELVPEAPAPLQHDVGEKLEAEEPPVQSGSQEIEPPSIEPDQSPSRRMSGKKEK